MTKRLKSLLRRMTEGAFGLSAGVSSLAIILISIFMFSEGAGLFSAPAVEEHYGLYVHSANRVPGFSIEECKRFFDHEIKNWSELGGADAEIELLTIDDIISICGEEALGDNYEHLPRLIAETMAQHPYALAFLPDEYVQPSPVIRAIDMGKVLPRDFFGGQAWMPTAVPVPLFGALPLILGTLLVSVLAIVIALPLGLSVAIYLSELASPLVRRILRPTLELLAGIPSVVYGFWGLTVLVPWIQQAWSLPVGETALAGGILLAIMALPTIISVAQDAIQNVPQSLREASLSLGATKWQSIYLVILPAARSGIFTASILGIGRAVGETMAVLMVTGNAALIPHSVFDSVRTIPATIAAELGEVPIGGAHYQALFILGAILFVSTMLMSLASEFVSRRSQKL
ncbi:MAG: phosphate ABC transporter permease subunit PstC [Porphyromonas sp.]|nr:phosphate ABC transporter permease subunit PstC [Porphyromonas sp.]